jgi:hypothetical protein
MIGTTAALIFGGLMAGGQVASSAMQSRAANKAAKTQVQAGDKALQFQREMWESQQRNFEPYRQAGLGALTRLSDMANTSPSSWQEVVNRPATSPKAAPDRTVVPQASSAMGTLAGGIAGMASALGGGAKQGNVVPFRAMANGVAQGFAQPRPQAGSPVQMRAPTGEIAWVRADHVEAAKKKGAVLVTDPAHARADKIAMAAGTREVA